MNVKKSNHLIKLADYILKEKSAKYALKIYQEATDLNPDDPQTWIKLGKCQRKLHTPERQLTSYQKAVELSPCSDKTIYQLGCVLESLHRIDELSELLNKNLNKFETSPYISALQAIYLWKLKNYDASELLLNKCLKLQPSATLNSKIHWLLGKVADKQGRFSVAYNHVLQMNKLEASLISDMENRFREKLTRLHRFHDECPLNTSDTFINTSLIEPKPLIFLVGFPRSGTTLMGSILNSHPTINTRDEWGGVSCILKWLKKKGFSYPECLVSLDMQLIEEMKTIYLDHLQALDGVHTVDKMPLQLIHVPLIKLLFPDAPIIVMIRHPIDVCLSCYMQRFTLNSAMKNFLTLENTLDTYDQVMSLFKKYTENNVDMNIKIVHYESLVNDIEVTTQSVCQFLSIPWSEKMLSFYKSAQRNSDIQTPSYDQVTQPIYNSSINKWKNYREFMEPRVEKLDSWCRYFGYPAISLP